MKQLLCLYIAGASLTLSSLAPAQVPPGDILLGVFDSSGSAVHQYQPNGTQVIATTGGTGGYFEGAALTASGLFVTTRRSPNGFDLFDPATGLEVATHNTSTIAFLPADVDVFADGTLAIADQDGQVELYTEAGAHLGTVTHANMARAFGLYIDAHDDLWIGDIPVVGLNLGNVFHFDRTGAFIAQYTTPFEIGDLVVAPDGTIWCADRNHASVVHLSSTGTILSSFATAVPAPGFDGIGLAADGTLFVTGEHATDIYHYDAAGTLLGQFPIVGLSGLPLFLSVVEPPMTVPIPYCTAGTTTNGCTPQIAANLNPSVSSANACNITVTGVEGQKSGIVFYGINNVGFTPGPWALGSMSLLCVKHPTQRTTIQNSGGTFNVCNGTLVLDWNAYQAAHPLSLGNPWSVGAKVYAQAWFRDPTAVKATNLSNAMEMTYTP